MIALEDKEHKSNGLNDTKLAPPGGRDKEVALEKDQNGFIYLVSTVSAGLLLR